MNNDFLKNKQWKKKSFFGLKGNKSGSWLDSHSAEYIPLALDNDFDSDEEITLHDVELLKVRQRGPTRSSSVSNIYPKSKLYQNGEGSRSDPFLQCDFVPLELKKEDTLQSISVKYNCSISDLKRANNLISNQEFYGLSKLKIPVRRHGFASELLHDIQDAEANVGEPSEIRTIDIGIGPIRSSSPKEAAEFLRKMDEDLVQIVQKTKTTKKSLEEAAAVLSAPVIRPLVKHDNNNSSGLGFWHLMVCIVMLIIFPIVVVLYLYFTRSLDIGSYGATVGVAENMINSTKASVLIDR